MVISAPDKFFLVGLNGSGQSATGSATLQESQQERPLVEPTEPTVENMVLEVPQLFNPPYDGYNGLHELTIPDDVTDLAYIESAMVKGMSKQQSVLSSSVAGVPNLKLSVNDMIEVEFENTFRHPVQSICLVSMHNILITLLNNGLTDSWTYGRTVIQTDGHTNRQT